MSFLPIVDRELRISSRRPATYRMRWILVVAVLLVWFFLLANSQRISTAQRGRMLFMAVGILAFVFSLFSGVFLTADCLSHEKREGTLGLLFLTNLRGYDVVLGKLIATSLHAFYGLLAILPLLSLPLLIGGVSVGQFWRVTVSLLTTMLVSLSVGMIVSAVARDTRTSLGLTLLGLLLLAGLPPAAWALGHAFRIGLPDSLLYLSPAYLYKAAHDRYVGMARQLTDFTASLSVLLSLVALFLSAAAVWLRRSWRDKGEAVSTGQRRGTRARWRFAARPAGEFNPCSWLFYRDRMPKRFALIVIGALFAVWVCFVPGCFSSSWRIKEPCFSFLMFGAFAMHLLLKVFITTEAARRLNEDRRSGALELLLVSPLNISQIISAQASALRAMFVSPVLILVAVNAFMLWLVAGPDPMRMHGDGQAMMCELYFGGLALLFLDAWALTWVGMLMGFRKRRHHWAIFAALGRIVLLPWLGIFFFGLLIATSGGPSTGGFIALALFYFIFAGLFDAALAAWAHQGLLTELREAPGLQTPFAATSQVPGAPAQAGPIAA
jgi:ABC-type transport system involved in cytochrome c biogenesis permease component